MSGDVLQRLYDSEINFSISTFWDGGFDWALGDQMNGFHAMGTAPTFDEVVKQLESAAHRHYPKSVFHLGMEQFTKEQVPDAT